MFAIPALLCHFNRLGDAVAEGNSWPPIQDCLRDLGVSKNDRRFVGSGRPCAQSYEIFTAHLSCNFHDQAMILASYTIRNSVIWHRYDDADVCALRTAREGTISGR